MLPTSKKNYLRLTAVFATIGFAGIIYADEVHVMGSTLGSFNANPFVTTDTLLDLVYDNSTFDNTTVGGTLDLGGNPVPGLNFNNLGSFSLGLTDNIYDGNTFQLMVTFTSPTTIVGGDSTVFTDMLFGTVSGGLGGVFIDFDNTPQTFFFSNANEAGSFTMFVNDVSIAPGQSSSLTGHISGSQLAVPEPTALAGLFVGALGLMRLRRSKKA